MRRRTLLALAPWLLLAPTVTVRAQDEPAPTRYSVYVGSYTGGPTASEGIYRLDLDLATGTLTPKGVAAKTTSPSFLAIHPNRKFLYAVNEVGSFDGKTEGGVTSFAINPDGTLREINHQTSGGTYPCHLAVEPTGKALLTANYGNGSVASYPLADDGSIGPMATQIDHKGTGPNKARQHGPHAHSVDFDPSQKFVLANDLGTDQTLIYRLDPATAKLTPGGASASAPGAGPRHLAFHPTDPVVYVIHELNSTITASRFDAGRGSLEPVQTVSTLPPEGNPNSFTAEVAVHPSGRFVYGSNRGADTMAIFGTEPKTGKLTPIGMQPTGGKTPRHFAIDPTGAFLIAANQGSNTLVVFKVDPQAGTLTPVGEPVAVPVPVCVLFTTAVGAR